MPLITYDVDDILRVLPHRGDALVIDSAMCYPEDLSAVSLLTLRPDDPRVTNHFGIFPGVLIAEFAHLTGALLVLSCMPGEIDADALIVLKKTESEFLAPAIPKRSSEQISCDVQIITVSENEKEITCQATIIQNSTGKVIAKVKFIGVITSKSFVERMVARKRR